MTPGTQRVIEAFRTIRVLGDELWTATTEAEALTLARRHCLREFGADVVMTDVHAGLGTWTDFRTLGDREGCERLELFQAFSAATFTPALLEELHYAATLLEPGDVLTRATSPAPSREFAEQFERALDVVDWADVDFMVARVKSSRGLTAGLAVIDKKQRRIFGALDQARLRAVAELTSHALSGLP